MTDEERKARDWLLGFSTSDYPHERETAITLLTMLARPVMPEEPDYAALLILMEAHRDQPRKTYRALYAHLTAPKTRTEWRVWWECLGCDYSTPEPSKAAADKCAEDTRRMIKTARFIHVTGPHEVPA